MVIASQPSPTPYSSTRPIGLVLGAGGVRGYAHAGVIEVLQEAGIPIDLVVGASVGAIFGLGLATGLPTEVMTRAARQGTARQLLRFYAGRMRLTSRDPIARMLRDAAGSRTFADLRLPFAVRATDMETGLPVTIDTGPVLPAVQASIALPLVARPVEIDGRHYLDGGLFDTAPVQCARQMGARTVIAVCLGVNYLAPRSLRNRPWTQPMLTRMGRQGAPVTGSFGDQLRFGCRLLAAGFSSPQPGTDADLAIWPEFGSVGPNSLVGAAFCYRRGVEAAQTALPEIERILIGGVALRDHQA